MNNSHIKDKLHAIVQHNTLIKDNMKTAVEWLEEEIGKKNMGAFLEEKIKTAKEMDIKNIKKAYDDGKRDAYRQDDVPTANEYVYQKYGV